MKIINYILLFTLFYGCVAGDVGGKKDASDSSSQAAIAPINPSITTVSQLPLPTVIAQSLSNTSLNFTASIVDPDALNFTARWYVNSVLTQGPSTSSSQSFTINPQVLGVGIYTIYLEVTDGGSTLYDSRTWSVNVAAPTFTGFSVANSPATSNTFHAINATSYALNGFTMNGTNNSRGTPMIVTGFAGGQDFCLRQTGLGPGLATDYKVVFLDATDTPMSPALPIGLPFGGIGTDTCLFAFNSLISFAGAPTTNKVKAVVYNTAFISNPEVIRQEWDINVEAINTNPIISIDTGSSTPLASIVQGTAASFAITVEDKDQNSALAADFAINYTINSSPLDGASSMPLDSGSTTPDCSRALGETTTGKYICTVTFNYFGDSGSLPDSSVYTVQVTATDSTALTSNTVTWLAQPSEVSTAPSFQNVNLGVAVVNPLTDTYIYDNGDNTASIATASEGDTLGFQVNISEPERDDYSIVWEYYDGVAAAYQTAAVTTAVTRSNTTDPVATASATFTVPQSTVTGAASAAVNFRVTVTDSPDTVGASSVSQIFSLTVTDVNPAPTLGAGAPSPTLASDNFVTEGTSISLSHSGTFSDTSTADGDTVVFQWQKDIACTGTFTSIAGATSSSLNWSPNVGSGALVDGATVCFRLCYGDDGFGNPADCSGGTVGPWVGSASSFTTVRESDQSAVASASATHASWMDGVDDQYIVTSLTDQVTVTQNQYNNSTGAYTAPVRTVTFDSDSTSPGTGEVPLDISIIGNATHIWVAYRIEEEDFFVTPTSVMRVRRIDRATLSTVEIFDINIVTSKVGSISHNGTNWYLPYIDFNNSDHISFRYEPLATAGGTTTAAVSAVTTPITDIYSSYDSVNTEVVVVYKDVALGNHHMTTLDVSSGAPTSPATALNIFGGASVSNISVSAARVGNSFNYVGAKNTSNQLVLYRNDSVTLANPDLKSPVDPGVTEINGFTSLKIQAGVDGASNEVYAATVRSSNAYLTRIVGLTEKVSKVVNHSVSSVSAATNNDIHLFIQENFISGTGTDTTNDTIFFTFGDGANIRSVPVNIEDSSFTDATPFFQ
jgi:hypothetical protein